MKQTILLLFLLIAIFIKSQTIVGVILSKEDKKYVPYAKIGVENSEIGTLTDENGRFSIDISKAEKNSKLKIEVAGFEKYIVSVSSLIVGHYYEIYLTEKPKEIDEVFIHPIKTVERNWGIRTKTKKAVLYYPSKSLMIARKTYDEELLKRNNVREAAVYFSNHKKVKIQKINMNFAFFNVEKPIKYKFVFYSSQEEKPNELLDFEEIIVEVNNKDIVNQTLSIDVSDRNIWMKNDFFVSAQMLNYDYEGELGLCLGIPGKAYYRKFVGNWEKIKLGFCPAINIDVKVEK